MEVAIDVVVVFEGDCCTISEVLVEQVVLVVEEGLTQTDLAG